MQKRTRIKICGLKQEGDVEVCREEGVDAVGFVFYKDSVRYVTPEQAARLSGFLGPWQTPVALFVNPEESLVMDVVQRIPMVLLQFHGDETPEFCESFRRPYLKAIRMKPDTDLAELSGIYESAAGLLVDSWSEGFGGSGHTFEWSLLPETTSLRQPMILSGGLTDLNVSAALHQIRPYGVDVSSGVESSRGVKCSQRIRAFCDAVRKADQAICS